MMLNSKSGMVAFMIDNTREKYIDNLMKTYRLVNVLADKNDCKTIRLRHRKKGQDIVLHSFPKVVFAYEKLHKIQNENLPLIYDVINLDDGQIVLEEYVEGLTVAQVMESGKYTFHGARKVIEAVCNALSVLHSQGIIHRDIKPENIIIQKNGRIVLIDFNASRKKSYNSKDTVVMGTVGYASPEQLGISQTDERTDIYALGILFNVMLTGAHPSEMLATGKAGKIVKKCTQINQNERYQTVKNLFEAL